MPTLTELSRALPQDLVALTDLPGDAEISAVHVSELVDPTPYLDGGELLLTTGLALPRRLAQVRAYAARLSSHGVTGLAVGLGPVHAEVPDALVTSCRAAGLPLLVVPAPTPFQSIIRTYWSLVSRDGEAALQTALGAHRDLARAAMSPNPLSAMIRVLGTAAGGWAARLGPTGAPVEVWPRRRRGVVTRLRSEVDRLRSAGPHAASTFALAEHDVMVQPLLRGSRLIGFVAVGCARPITHEVRGIVLGGCTLLATVLDDTVTKASAERARRACVVDLIAMGRSDAAVQLAAQTAPSPAPRRGAVLSVVPGPDRSTEELLEDLVSATAERTREPLWATADDSSVTALVPPAQIAAVAESVDELHARTDPALRGRWSPVVATLNAAPTIHATVAAAKAAEPADLRVPGEREDGLTAATAASLLTRLQSYERAPLVPTVVEYLRHRGHWERVADATGTHRNTVRARIAAAHRVLECDLDDPDVAATLWLALRAQGLA